MEQFSTPLWSISACLLLRMLNAFIIQTFYVPDEYWQSLEVAHHAVFGYGHLTWEWDKRIRGFLHPLLFAIPFSFLQIFGIDSRAAVIATPKIVQAFFAAVGDLFFYRFATRVVGVEAAKWATLAYLTNYFTLFSLPRTLSNSLETILSVIALSVFPFPRSDDQLEESAEERDAHLMMKHISLSALTIVVRPTAIVTWIPLWLPKLLSREIERREKFRFCAQLVGVAFIALVASTALDSFYYGRLTFVPWEFIKWNVFEDVASFYGSHPFHWYFTQGFPVILGPHLVPFVLALHLVWKQKFSTRVDLAMQQYRDMQRKKEQKLNSKLVKPTKVDRNNKVLAVEESSNVILVKMIFWIIFIYSLLGHKEFRFIFTTLPFAMCLVGKYYASMDSVSDFGWGMKKAVLIGGVTLMNLSCFFYLAIFHQRGNLDVVDYVANRLDHMDLAQRNDSFILFLLPCHQHPYYSYLHRDVEMRFLRCEPWFAVANGPNSEPVSSDSYIDEAEQFFAEPTIWLLNLLSNGQLPSHVVLSGKTEKQLSPLLKDVGLEKTNTFFHSHFEMDGRMGTELFLYESAK